MIAEFALRLLFGISLMWVLMPRADVTAGFFRIQMLLALGLSTVAALFAGQLPAATGDAPPLMTTAVVVGFCIALAFLCYAGSIVWTLGRRGAGGALVWTVMIGSALVLAGTTLSRETATTAAGLLLICSELTSAASLGGAMTGMLLGHWYLTAPTMSIKPLDRVNALFGGAVLLRLLVSAIALAWGWNQLTDTTHAMWASLRWLAGILGPLILVVMVWRILRLRNTQSATGVLFVAVILTFIGELSATLLLRELGVPI